MRHPEPDPLRVYVINGWRLTCVFEKTTCIPYTHDRRITIAYKQQPTASLDHGWLCLCDPIPRTLSRLLCVRGKLLKSGVSETLNYNVYSTTSLHLFLFHFCICRIPSWNSISTSTALPLPRLFCHSYKHTLLEEQSFIFAQTPSTKEYSIQCIHGVAEYAQTTWK